jgi:hypothetical protein
MPERKFERAARKSVARIEICLPRVFPWKLRGGFKRATEVSQSPSPTLEENDETFADTNHGHSHFVC